ncbi:MAG: diguanylate cyclase [Myxococcota bacterium]|nr:diguanylate cyclase [Myxococcota bacterium]
MRARLRSAMERFWDPGPSPLQVLLQQGWMLGLATVTAGIAGGGLALHPDNLLFRALLVLSAGGGLLVFWLGWALLMWAVSKQKQRDREANESLATVLEATAMGAVMDHGRTLHPRVSDAMSHLAHEHSKLVRTLQTERQRAAFSRDLAEALDIADTSREVYEIARRVAAIRLRDADFALVVDHGEGKLEWEVQQGERACACASSKRCPALRKGRMMEFAPDSGLARCSQLLQDDTHAVCAPVAVTGKNLAVVQAVFERQPPLDAPEACSTLAHSLGTRLGVVISLQEREHQANTDPLTGLSNRRAMNQLLGDLDEAAGPYAVVACDLDHFKSLNDTYGHEVGDRCLNLFAQVLQEVCRASDLPCRPGGEEFTVVLPHADVLAGEQVGERIRARLLHASHAAGRPFTVSIGVAATQEGEVSPETLLERADMALYAAKEAGRDRVVTWTEGLRRQAA